MNFHGTARRGRLLWILSFAVLALGVGEISVAADARDTPPKLSISPAPPLPASMRRVVPESIEELRAIEKQVQSLNGHLQQVTVGVRRGPAQGTGVIISPDGYVLTAAHVSGRPGSRVTVILHDGTHLTGRSLGRENYIDAGLIQIIDEGDWPVAAVGDISSMRPGDWVIGIGHPGGFRDDRPGVARLGRLIAREDWVLRTDVALVGGDSGGPLFDLHGRVIGIHSRIGPDPNLNFHVPINVYRDSWHWLLASEQRPVASEARPIKERAGGPLLGVHGEDADQACRVTRVFENSPADDANIKVGDLIVRIDHRFILGMDDLVASVNHYDAGEVIDVTIYREGSRMVVPVKLGQRPDPSEESSEPDSDTD